MDTNIRNLLSLAEKSGGESSLLEAFQLLRSDSGPVIDKPDAFNQDLYVLCAETAHQLYDNVEIAEECLKLYFQRSPVANQFLCRAYLCQAQIYAPTSAENSEQLDTAVVYLLKAINLAKENTRYHFLIYNASVIFWKFARPFLKPNYRRHLAVSLHQVVKALDDIDDKDHEWRVQLMIALIECHMDAGHRNDASSIAIAASTFIQHYVPSYFKTLLGIMVQHQLMDVSKLDKLGRSSPEISIYYRICKLKTAIEQNDAEVSVRDEAKKILAQINGAKKSLKERVISATQLDENKVFSRKARQTGSVTSVQSLILQNDSEQRPHLLLELGRLALDQNLVDTATECIELLRATSIDDQSFALETEFMECALMVCNLEEKQESYEKSIVDVRLAAVRRCDEALSNAIRACLSSAIQAGCATQWNLCLPLLQNNLRKHVRRPLTAVADALERIQSLLIQLRCQVHMELAKCEEDREQIQVALDHLRKALALDDGKVYQDRLQVALQRLQLRAELYEQPEREEDQAAMMIEQARKADFGTIRMKRSLLVRAGQALAPDSFLLVLESESDTKVTAADAKLSVLAGRANQFISCTQKAASHLRRLGDRSDQERAALWGDLAKTARKQEVWDVCRVACRFCLLYDDGRWKNEVATPNIVSSPRYPTKAADPKESPDTDTIEPKLTRELTQLESDKTVPLYEKDLIRMMAEVNFINAEALIHLLRCEGVELGDLPPPPVIRRSRKEKPICVEEDPNWITYCNWLKSLSKHATACFTRAIKLAIELNESWIACCAATYMWNYNVHRMLRGSYDSVVSTMQTALNGLRQLGHDGETALLVNICTALATGLMQPWLPPSVPKQPIFPNALPVENPEKTRELKSPTKGRKSPAAKTNKALTPAVVISADATPSLKKALEVCEYGMVVTNGSNTQDVVSIATRRPLLETWVAVKQMLQTQIGRTLGTDDETSMECQSGMTRAIVAIRMLELNGNGVMDFKEIPTLSQVVDLMLATKWSDHLTCVQLWVRLAHLALDAKDHNIVSSCTTHACQTANRFPSSHGDKYVQCRELLSHVCMIMGQSLIENSIAKSSQRHLALAEFVNSARFGRDANNASLVTSAVRRYWNAALPLISQPIERELLRQPIKMLLEYLNETTDLLAFRKNKEDEDDDGASSDVSHSLSARGAEGEVKATAPVGGGTEERRTTEAAPVTISSEDDLILRVALYGVLFQCYADKGEWTEGLAAMDQAVADMPRTKHRLMIYKHLVLVKAKLGIDISGSIHKFKGENEEQLSQLWRRVALSCGTRQTQMTAYMNAIEVLSGVTSEWQKLDYLLEFGEWLYCAELPLSDAVGVLNWALDILQQMNTDSTPKTEDETLTKTNEALGKRKKSRRGGGLVHGDSAKSKKELEVHRKDSDKSLGVSITVTAEPEHKPIPEQTVQPVVPTEKHVVIGTLPSSRTTKMADFWDVQQLEYLLRTHTMLAQMYAFGPLCRQHCFVAYGYVLRIWQVVLTSSIAALQEIAKNPPPDTGKLSAKSKVKKEKEQEVKEKPKRRLPMDAIPQTLDEWSSYEMPDEMLEACEHELMKRNAINSRTFTKPLLTLHYLDLLTQKLRELGFNQFNLPILAMIDVLSRHLIKSEPLKCLAHLRAYEVCLELDLTAGCEFHQMYIHYTVNEEEQARSREELTRHQDRRAQVAKEEARIKETLETMSFNESTRKEVRLQSRAMRSKVDTDAAPIDHLGRKLTTLQLRDVWADTAEVLLRNGIYQPARELLNEANLSAQAFEDKALQARIMYLFAKLAFLEAQYDQAISMCLEAQSLHNGDETFWYKTISLMANSYLEDYKLSTADRCKQATLLLDHAIDVFKQVAVTRPNKALLIRYILAKLQAKRGMCDAKCALEMQDKWSLLLKVDSDIDILSNSVREEAECELLEIGCHRDAVKAINERLSILMGVVHCSLAVSLKHAYYIKTLEAQEQAVEITVGMLNDALALSTTQELYHVSLAAQREAAQERLKSAHLMLEIFEEFVKEQRQETNLKQQQSDTAQVLDEVTRETPIYTDKEQQWNDLTSTLPERILAHLESAHSLVGSNLKLKAKVLLYTGRCMRLLSLLKSPDRPLLWQVNTLSLLKSTQPQIREFEVNEVNDDNESIEYELPVGMTKREAERYRRAVTIAQEMQTDSLPFLTHATECLIQAMNLALQKGFVEVAGMASLELVECIGEFDPGLSSQLLALHQSCSASAYLEGLLNRATLDTSLSQIAALLRQRANLSAFSVHTNMDGKAGVLKKINQCLEDNSLAFKRLKISPHHLDFLKEFPTAFTFLVLQHSPDKSRLYGAVLDHNKAGTKSPQKGASPPGSKARVVSADVTHSTFQDIISRYNQFKNEVKQHLLKMEYQKCRSATCERLVSTLDTQLAMSTSISERDEVEKKLKQDYASLMESLGQYLHPVLSQFNTILKSATASVGSRTKETAAPPDDYLVLLLDEHLLQLPLEELPTFVESDCTSITRDISLQMFYNRFHVERLDEAAEKLKKEKEKTKPPPRIPGLRDASKKQSKIIPLDRTVPNGFMPVDTHSFRYIVDPHLDCSDTEHKKPIEVFNAILEEHIQQFTPRWLGIMGNEHTPSQAEYEIYMLEGSAFIFYGFERFLSYLPPHKVAATNFPDCQLVMLLDQNQTSYSFSRQSTIDVNKRKDELELEKPFETAMLLSLSGVNCLYANMWHSSISDNAENLEATMKNLLTNGKTSGEAVRVVAMQRHQLMAEQNVPPPPSSSLDVITAGRPVNTTLSITGNLVCYGLPSLLVTQLTSK